MSNKTILICAICVMSLVAALYGCSSGKSTDAGGGTGSQQATIAGVAATGTAINGTITLKDSSTPQKALSMNTTSGGNYSFDVTNLTRPFILKTEWTDASSANTLYSFTAGPGTANINPFSHAVYAAAAGVSDPSTLPAMDAAAVRAIAAKHPAAAANLMSKLAPLFALYGTTTDPISGNYTADHTGLDALFDDVRISVSQGMIVVTNKKTSMVIFSASINDIGSGSLNMNNMPSKPGTASTTTPATTDGAMLYASNCSGCHGALATSSKLGRTAAQIQAAIGSISAMSGLSSLTSAQIQAIATVLGGATPAPGSASTSTSTTDGAALYASNCSGCHGALATSSKLGRTAAQITAAIGSISAMSGLSSLTSLQIQAIATALAPVSSTPTPTTPTTTDGATLYASNCSGCHGALAISSKLGRTAAQITAAIGSISAMSGLSSLTSSQIQAIATALATTTPAPTPTDGPTLYSINCSGCHGALATSSIKGSTTSDIQSAINSVGAMKSLSTLTSAQIQAIAAAIK